MPASPSLLLRNGQVVTPRGIRRADVLIAEGKIAFVGIASGHRPNAELNIDGQYLMPGLIDAHVHFNEPGRTEWEGLETGSRALAAGGGTVFFDMPLNSEPPVIDAAALAEKRRLAEAKSATDFALWGGLVSGNEEAMEGLRDAGAIGLKAFMCASGIDSFAAIDGEPLRRAMKRAAALGMLVAVHAEDDALATKLTAAARARGDTSIAAYLLSRPVEAETEAIRRVLDYAGETSCKLHIVHVSSPEGIDLVAAAKARGVDVTAETCPHYLLLTDADVQRLGAPAKCAPPLRGENRRLALWSQLRQGKVDTIGSDHSPAPGAMKTGDDFFAIWGGIAGVQHGVTLLLAETATTRERDWPRLAAAVSENVARRFRLPPTKGQIVEGADADFSILSFQDPSTPILETDLLTRHAISPYIGRPSAVRVAQTFVRGHPVFVSGSVSTPRANGQFLRPV